MDLVIEQHATGAGYHEVCLLLLAMAVREGAAHVRCVAKEADAEIARVEVFASEATLDARGAIPDGVLDLEQVHAGKSRHVALLWRAVLQRPLELTRNLEGLRHYASGTPGMAMPAPAARS